MITSAAMKNGFTGGLIVDFPNSKKAKKYFLFLMAGYSEEIIKDAEKAVYIPKAREHGEDYSFESNSEEDEDMGGDDEEVKEEDEDGGKTRDQEEESDEDDFKPKEHTIKKTGTIKRLSKTIQKARKKQGRFKANGNRKNKEWIMKKKDR